MKYQSSHSMGNYHFSLSTKKSENFCFPVHLHKSYEVFFVAEGEVTVHISGIDFTVKKDECAVILPGQYHSYQTEDHSLAWLCIFSSDFLPDLKDHSKKKQKHYPIISAPSAYLWEKLSAADNVFSKKAILYDLAARYISSPSSIEFPSKNDDMICQIVQYLDEHFRESISLHSLADYFGYNYRYMSGIINRCFNTSFSKVIQQYRIDYACRLLRETGDSITEISSLCGFDTTRSFNRCFKEIMEMTPKKYRGEITDAIL